MTSKNRVEIDVVGRLQSLLLKGKIAEASWCLNRIALRTLCVPALERINTRAIFNLIKSSVLLSSAIDNEVSVDVAFSATERALTIDDIGAKENTSAAYAFYQACNSLHTAALVLKTSVHTDQTDPFERTDKINPLAIVIDTYNEAQFESTVADIETCETNSLQSKYLWASGYEALGSSMENKLISNIEGKGLHFLVKDLQNLFNSLPSFNRIENYQLELSYAIEQDAELLERAILLGEDTKSSQNVRILLLGSGGAGKTQLARRLRNQEYDGLPGHATAGLEILPEEAVDLFSFTSNKNSSANVDTNNLTTYLWDFGGQKLFHGLHSTFMHENAVYIVVVDSRHEQAVDYWLYQIQHIAGRHASVVVVTNEYEGCNTRQNETRLARLFPEMISMNSFYYFSCLDPVNPLFVEHLLAMCMDSQKRIFSTTAKVIEELKIRFKRNRFLFKHELDEITQQIIGINGTLDESIHSQLRHLGKVIYIDGGSDKICLNPDWLIESAYTLINSKLLQKRNGMISISSIRKEKDSIFGIGAINDSEIDQLLTHIMQVGQCTLIENLYLFPDATHANEPKSTQLYTHNENSINLFFDLPYFPIGLHASMVSTLHGMNGLFVEPSTIWREGFILNGFDSDGKRIRIATVEYELRGGGVRVHTLHPNSRIVSNALLRIKNHLHDVFPNTTIENSVTPYISYKGNYSFLNWERFIDKLDQDDQSISVVINHFNGDLMRNKNVTSINRNEGTVSSQVGGYKNNSQTAVNRNSDLEKGAVSILDSVISQYLSEANKLSPEDLQVVTEVNTAIHVDDQSKLKQFWSALQNVTGFVANTTTAGQFAIDHRSTILSALASVSSSISK